MGNDASHDGTRSTGLKGETSCAIQEGKSPNTLTSDSSSSLTNISPINATTSVSSESMAESRSSPVVSLLEEAALMDISSERSEGQKLNNNSDGDNVIISFDESCNKNKQLSSPDNAQNGVEQTHQISIVSALTAATPTDESTPVVSLEVSTKFSEAPSLIKVDIGDGDSSSSSISSSLPHSSRPLIQDLTHEPKQVSFSDTEQPIEYVVAAGSATTAATATNDSNDSCVMTTIHESAENFESNSSNLHSTPLPQVPSATTKNIHRNSGNISSEHNKIHCNSLDMSPADVATKSVNKNDASKSQPWVDPVLRAAAVGAAARQANQARGRQSRIRGGTRNLFSSLWNQPENSSVDDWKRSLQRLATTAASTASSVASVAAPVLVDASKVMTQSAGEFADALRKEFQETDNTDEKNADEEHDEKNADEGQDDDETLVLQEENPNEALNSREPSSTAALIVPNELQLEEKSSRPASMLPPKPKQQAKAGSKSAVFSSDVDSKYSAIRPGQNISPALSGYVTPGTSTPMSGLSVSDHPQKAVRLSDTHSSQSPRIAWPQDLSKAPAQLIEMVSQRLAENQGAMDLLQGLKQIGQPSTPPVAQNEFLFHPSESVFANERLPPTEETSLSSLSLPVSPVPSDESSSDSSLPPDENSMMWDMIIPDFAVPRYAKDDECKNVSVHLIPHPDFLVPTTLNLTEPLPVEKENIQCHDCQQFSKLASSVSKQSSAAGTQEERSNSTLPTRQAMPSLPAPSKKEEIISLMRSSGAKFSSQQLKQLAFQQGRNPLASGSMKTEPRSPRQSIVLSEAEINARLERLAHSTSSPSIPAMAKQRRPSPPTWTEEGSIASVPTRIGSPSGGSIQYSLDAQRSRRRLLLLPGEDSSVSFRKKSRRMSSRRPSIARIMSFRNIPPQLPPQLHHSPSDPFPQMKENAPPPPDLFSAPSDSIPSLMAIRSADFVDGSSQHQTDASTGGHVSEPDWERTLMGFPLSDSDDEGETSTHKEYALDQALMAFLSLESFDLRRTFPKPKIPKSLEYMASVRWRRLVSHWKHEETAKLLLKRQCSLTIPPKQRESGLCDCELSSTSSSTPSMRSRSSVLQHLMTAQDSLFANNSGAARLPECMENESSLSTFLCSLGPLEDVDDGELRHSFPKSNGELVPKDLVDAAESQVSPFVRLLGEIVRFASLNEAVLTYSVDIKCPLQIQRKTQYKYNGDVARVKDVLRAEITCPDEGSLVCALLYLERLCRLSTNDSQGDGDGRPKIEIVRMKNLFRADSTEKLRLTSLPTGYRHILVNIRLNDGILAEIQFQLQSFFTVLGLDGYALHREYVDMEFALECKNRRNKECGDTSCYSFLIQQLLTPPGTPKLPPDSNTLVSCGINCETNPSPQNLIVAALENAGLTLSAEKDLGQIRLETGNESSVQVSTRLTPANRVNPSTWQPPDNYLQGAGTVTETNMTNAETMAPYMRQNSLLLQLSSTESCQSQKKDAIATESCQSQKKDAIVSEGASMNEASLKIEKTIKKSVVTSIAYVENSEDSTTHCVLESREELLVEVHSAPFDSGDNEIFPAAANVLSHRRTSVGLQPRYSPSCLASSGSINEVSGQVDTDGNIPVSTVPSKLMYGWSHVESPSDETEDMCATRFSAESVSRDRVMLLSETLDKGEPIEALASKPVEGIAAIAASAARSRLRLSSVELQPVDGTNIQQDEPNVSLPSIPVGGIAAIAAAAARSRQRRSSVGLLPVGRCSLNGGVLPSLDGNTSLPESTEVLANELTRIHQQKTTSDTWEASETNSTVRTSTSERVVLNAEPLLQAIDSSQPFEEEWGTSLTSFGRVPNRVLVPELGREKSGCEPPSPLPGKVPSSRIRITIPSDLMTALEADTPLHVNHLPAQLMSNATTPLGQERSGLRLCLDNNATSDILAALRQDAHTFSYNDVLLAITSAAVDDASRNLRDVPTFHCLYLLGRYCDENNGGDALSESQRSNEAKPLENTTVLTDQAKVQSFLRKVQMVALMRSLTIAYQATSSGMTGWLEYGSSNPLDRTKERPFDLLHRLACHFARNKDWEAALDLFQFLVSSCERHLPHFHPLTITAMLDLAATLQQNFKPDAARKVIWKASERLRSYLSNQELLCGLIMKEPINLSCPVSAGYEGGVSLLKAFTSSLRDQMSREFIKVIGDDHDVTLINSCFLADSFAVLANCVEKVGNESLVSLKESRQLWSTACRYYRRVFRVLIKTRTLRHPDVAATACAIARCYRELGERETALKVLNSVVSSFNQGASFSVPPNPIATKLDPPLPMICFFAQKHFVPFTGTSEPEMQARSEQVLSICLWLLAVLFVETNQNERGRIRALSLLHASSEALQRALGCTGRDSSISRSCLPMLHVVESEAKELFAPLEAAVRNSCVQQQQQHAHRERGSAVC